MVEAKTIDAMDHAELTTRKAEIWSSIRGIEGDDDAALKRLSGLQTELRKVNTAISEFAAKAESEQRDAAIVTMNDQLASAFDFKAASSLMQGIVISGVYRKSDTGWDDLKVGVGYEGDLDLLGVFHGAFPLDAVKDLTSVKGVSFTITREGAKVEYVGKAPRAPSSGGTGNGGGRGHGWLKDGASYTLDEAFGQAATSEERATHDGYTEDTVKSPGSAKWALKKKVVTAAGFTAG